jgi:4,5-DOPA dioxygenase extradiol
MLNLPTLFISHGSPMLSIVDSPARRFLLGLGDALPRPRAIVVISAHWESVGGPAVSLAAQPETIHDFGGFPAALFEIQYPAHGAPETAKKAIELLEQAGFAVKSSATRGLDHGAWVPLRLMYPKADIPVVQISLLRGASPAEHEKLGKALRKLRDEGVLIIGSGSLTHNLSEFRGHSIGADVPDWVSDFATWMNVNLENAQHDALVNYRSRAPFAARNHPTEEHLLPLFVAMGAAGDAPKVERLHASIEYGVLAMDMYAFS